MLEAERKLGRQRLKIKTQPPRPGKGSYASPFAPCSRIGHYRKYLFSAGASIGVTYCPFSSLVNRIRLIPRSVDLLVRAFLYAIYGHKYTADGCS